MVVGPDHFCIFTIRDSKVTKRVESTQVLGSGRGPSSVYSHSQYTPPPLGYGAYGSPQPGHGYPPPNHHGYGSPPPNLHAYGSPPPNQHGYGNPPLNQHGYGSPQPDMAQILGMMRQCGLSVQVPPPPQHQQQHQQQQQQQQLMPSPRQATASPRPPPSIPQNGDQPYVSPMGGDASFTTAVREDNGERPSKKRAGAGP